MYDSHMEEFISLEETVIEEFDSDEYDWGIDSESLREWQLACVGLSETDLPYSMRTVSLAF